MRRPIALILAALCVTAGIGACSSDPGPSSVVRTFIGGWASAKVDGVGFVDPLGAPMAPSVVAGQLKALAGDLDLSKIKVSSVGDPDVHGSDATANVSVDWPVAGAVWHYNTTVRLRGGQDTWRVVWSPSTVNPQLKAADVMKVRTTAAARGQVLDGAGQPIIADHPVVVVGIEPSKVTNQAALLTALKQAFAAAKVTVDLTDLPAQLAAAKPTAFVEVVTLRKEVYDQIAGQIHDLDGTVFRQSTLALAPTHDFARALLGTVGDVRKDQMDAHPGVYAVGDQVGQSGLEEQYDGLLRGTKGVQVFVDRGTPDTPAVIALYSVAPKPGTALRLTLDQRVQNAADAALAGQKLRAAVVAVRVSDGAVLAVANGPDGGGVNLALTAAVPPGSTFKTVTALATLTGGKVTADTVVSCPKAYTVQGRTFTNDNGFVLGDVPMHIDFAKSCNTAFAYLGGQLPPDGLKKTAATLGIGTTWNFGTEVFTGSVGANGSPVDQAAAGFGQGQTQVSPMALAGAAAAVGRGSWKQPTLFTVLPAGAPAPKAGGIPQPADGAALDGTAVAALRTMMREVVTAGTATPLAAVPGAAVLAKTGTAEYDNNPAHLHAWTMGYQGDIAFAVFVENGGESSATAVPIAGAFLRGLQ